MESEKWKNIIWLLVKIDIVETVTTIAWKYTESLEAIAQETVNLLEALI